jgi:Zn-dependent M28 family amino/carboxypeptidase
MDRHQLPSADFALEVGASSFQEIQGFDMDSISRSLFRKWCRQVLCAGFVLTCLAAVIAAGLASDKDAGREISKDRLLESIKMLASDEFEGRAPASRGEERTIKYLEEQFRQMGLGPGNPDGTFVQKVPMLGVTADPSMRLVFEPAGGSGKMELAFSRDFMAWTKRDVPEVSIDAPLVFVGYGIVAPEYQWDDYKGVDVAGKVLVMLVNDPPIPDPKTPGALDENQFRGKAMTYYGRWTYKFEIAAAKKAAGCLIIHETGPAGYPWEVVGNNTGERFGLVTPDKGMSRAAVEGWITYEKAKALFEMTGRDLDELKRTALDRGFRPVELGAMASLTIRNTIRRIDSSNFAAKVEGRDAKLRDEYVIYTAHWDHFGIGPEVKGDKIYNGARDNATGVAGIMEIARAFAKTRPRRSILFLATTGEEQGLLGAQYYAANPLYPLDKTLAVINLDVMNTRGRTHDITVVGLGMSSLDDDVIQAAREQGRVVIPDPEPEKGYYYRSDHFEFAKQGVPALDPKEGVEDIGKPQGTGLESMRRYTAEDYHKPSDEVKADWDLSGMVEDLELVYSVGNRVANAKTYPVWKPGTEFKSKREEMLSHAARK